MMIPIIVEFALVDANDSLDAFVKSIAITGFAGVSLALANRPAERMVLGTRDAFVTTTIVWISTCFFASLPFYMSGFSQSLLDACFEAVSSLTTTGATLLKNVDTIPRGILLWRSLLQWLGGIGIVVMAMTVFPTLRIGGMQLFRSEFSDRSEKILPRLSQIAAAIVLAYSLMTVICCGLLSWAGMNFFEAICHAMTAISTGGLSTRSGSIASFHNPAIEIILCFFMFIGGSTLMLYVRLWKKDWTVFKDSQLRIYCYYTVFMVGVFTIWYYFHYGDSFHRALRYGTFSVISFITSTGYTIVDYNAWAPFAAMMLFVLSFSGGCTGSTTGGIKIFRFQVMYALVVNYLRLLRRPNTVAIPVYQDIRITENVAVSVFAFLILYLLSIVSISSVLALTGVDCMSSLSAAVSSLGNVGPGITKVIGAGGHVSNISNIAKCVLMLSMILGRLELITVFVLFMSSFWRQ